MLVAFMLFLDLGVFHKTDHVITFKESAIWTAVWIGTAMLFCLVIFLKAEWIHGISDNAGLQAYYDKYYSGKLHHGIDMNNSFEDNLSIYRNTLGMEYLTGYFIEKALSIDNIFVMIMIFISFGIDKKYYHRVLFWGILGAIVLRFIFIFLSSALIQQFSWILAIFGGILIFSGIKMFFEKTDKKIDTEHHPVVRICGYRRSGHRCGAAVWRSHQWFQDNLHDSRYHFPAFRGGEGAVPVLYGGGAVRSGECAAAVSGFVGGGIARDNTGAQ